MSEFNQNKYINEWKKKNMKQVKATYKSDFVDDFKAACSQLGLKQSNVIKKAMQAVIDQAKKK